MSAKSKISCNNCSRKNICDHINRATKLDETVNNINNISEIMGLDITISCKFYKKKGFEDE